METRILIAEDDPRLREVLCDYFASKGVRPIQAEHGAQALELAQQEEFDAVLLDIMMPKLDGRGVCRALRRTQDVPILFLTALSDEEDTLLHCLMAHRGQVLSREQLLRPSQVCRWQEGHKLQEQFQAHGAEYREQKDEIQRLNQALTYAQAAEEHRRTFTSHMAHELKTPLAVIHSYAQGLQEHIAEDKREKYLATICSEAERMNDMVLELLDLSRLEAGRVKLRRENFSLSQLTRSTLEKLAPTLEAKGLRLSTALEDPAPVLADRGRMAQVVENLLTNAVKYTPAGGEIGVEVAQMGQHTILRVSNDCPPIPQEELDQLFEPFYRREDAAPGEGTGLGLAIVRHIVQLHGGSCTAQATQTGVQFTVTL